MPAKRLGRRTYIVDRRFQLKYTALLAVLGGVISLLFGGTMYLTVRDTEHRLLSLAPGAVPVAGQTDALLWAVPVISVLMGLALALLGVLVTHRVAGPLFVMGHYVSVLARGRYPILRPLRRTDELKAFFEQFQNLVEAMRLREVEEAELLEQAVAQLEPLAGSEEAKEALDSLRMMHTRKRDATDRVDIGAASVKNAA